MEKITKLLKNYSKKKAIKPIEEKIKKEKKFVTITKKRKNYEKS